MLEQRRHSEILDRTNSQPDVEGHGVPDVTELGTWLDRRFSLPPTDHGWSRFRLGHQRTNSHPTSVGSYWNSEKTLAAVPSWPSALDPSPCPVVVKWASPSPDIQSERDSFARRRRRRHRREIESGLEGHFAPGLRAAIHTIQDLWCTYVSFDIPLETLRDHLCTFTIHRGRST
jgi:hypothetical protein